MQRLTVEELRAYRGELQAEEDRISYWRRLTHGRIDVLTAQVEQGAALSHRQLVRALADTGSGRRRRGLMAIGSFGPLPELPDLDETWTEHVDPRDHRATARLLARLHEAERRLTAYRSALHERLDVVTAELIERYRQDPRLALRLLRTAEWAERG